MTLQTQSKDGAQSSVAGSSESGAAYRELQRLGVTARSDAAIYSLEICRLASQRLEPSNTTLEAQGI